VLWYNFVYLAPVSASYIRILAFIEILWLTAKCIQFSLSSVCIKQFTYVGFNLWKSALQNIRDSATPFTFKFRVKVQFYLKMLCLYHLTRIVYILLLNHTWAVNPTSVYMKKLPNIVIHACQIITERGLCWKSVDRKFGFVYISTHTVFKNR